MSAIDTRQVMAKVKAFPGMPRAATTLLGLLEDPGTTPVQIEEILRQDPGLTANLLKLTNSAYFGLPTQVGSVRQAVMLLGWKRVSQLVMTSCVSGMMDKPVPGYDLPAGELWGHSIAVSVAAEALVKELDVPGAQEVYTAGLLHDMGKVVLGTFVKEAISAIEAKAAEGVPFEVAEQAVLGTDHAEVGAQILRRWSLPAPIVNAVRWHHAPEQATEDSVLVDVVNVANVLCLMMGIGTGREGLQYSPSSAATKRLGLKEVQLELVASKTLQWVEELKGSPQ